MSIKKEWYLDSRRPEKGSPRQVEFVFLKRFSPPYGPGKPSTDVCAREIIVACNEVSAWNKLAQRVGTVEMRIPTIYVFHAIGSSHDSLIGYFTGNIEDIKSYLESLGNVGYGLRWEEIKAEHISPALCAEVIALAEEKKKAEERLEQITKAFKLLS